LPSDREDLATWVAEAIDADEHKRVIGRGWKNRVLDGANVHRLMTATPTHTELHFRVSMEEAIVLSRALSGQKLTRNAFMRRALAHWLIKHEGVDPDLIPKLAKDL
jgi:hypothetical protein